MNLNIRIIKDGRRTIAYCVGNDELLSKAGMGEGISNRAAAQSAVNAYFTHRDNALRAEDAPIMDPDVPDLRVGARVEVTGIEGQEGWIGTVKTHDPEPDGNGIDWLVQIDGESSTRSYSAAMLSVIPPALSRVTGGEGENDDPDWSAARTPRQRLNAAIAAGAGVFVTYTDAKDNVTRRKVKPLRFEGVGFQEKLLLIDIDNGRTPKAFFVKGISLVEPSCPS